MIDPKAVLLATQSGFLRADNAAETTVPANPHHVTHRTPLLTVGLKPTHRHTIHHVRTRLPRILTLPQPQTVIRGDRRSCRRKNRPVSMHNFHKSGVKQTGLNAQFPQIRGKTDPSQCTMPTNWNP